MDIGFMFLYAFLRFIIAIVKGIAYGITELCRWLKENKTKQAAAETQNTVISPEFLDSFRRRPEAETIQVNETVTEQ